MKRGEGEARAEAIVSELFVALLALYREVEQQDLPRHAKSVMIEKKVRAAIQQKKQDTDLTYIIEVLPTLSPTELRVFRLIGMGMTNNEIAGANFISPKTIRTHIKKVYDKLEVKGRANLAVISHRICFGGGKESKATAEARRT
jgi:DNA-binding CsgD family transcriptional regulator